MSFILDQSPTFQAKVKFTVAGADPSKRTDAEFTAIFKRKDQEAVDGVSKPRPYPNSEDPQKPIMRVPTDDELVREVLAGWGPDVTDSSGSPKPFTPEALDALLNIPGMAGLIAGAFVFESQALPRKN